MTAVLKKKETEIQRLVHKYLSDTSVYHLTASGKSIQILSAGSINVHEGPDFKDIAVLIEGKILVGDAEFHKNTNDWIKHNHSSDPNYNDVILHIALSGPHIKIENCEHLFIDPSKLEMLESEKVNDISYLDVQEYAMKRLIATAEQNAKLLGIVDLTSMLRASLKRFQFRYDKKRRRPSYSSTKLNSSFEGFVNPLVLDGLRKIKSREDIDIDLWFDQILLIKHSIEGSALRKEVLINSILPLAYCCTPDTYKEYILNYYWSIKSSNKYGILKRRFPSLSQEYIWQQQGMLEIIKELYPNNKLKESDIDYMIDNIRRYSKDTLYSYN